MSVGELLDKEPGARAELESLWLGYTESPGSPALRREIAKLYDGITADDVLVHAGAEEAIYSFFNVMLSRGDHVVVHWPCYQSHYEIPKALGCEVSKWEGGPLDLRPNTRAVVVNFPHNPTGDLPTRAEFDALVSQVAAHGALLFCDEVYRGLERPGDRLPAACDAYENAVSLGVMSKSYGLAGLRVGWIATKHRGVYEAMAAFKDYTTICTSAPSEFLATLALRHGDEILEKNRSLLAANAELLGGFFERQGERIDGHVPDAGPVCFPRLRDGDADAFCRALLEKTGILLAPGSKFGAPGGSFRMGLGRRSFGEILPLLEEYIQTRTQ